jgi:hypothetical protein
MSVVSGQWSVVSSLLSVVRGPWSVVSCLWPVGRRWLQLAVVPPRQSGYRCHRECSHSRESGNPLGKPSQVRYRRTGFPLSRE